MRPLKSRSPLPRSLCGYLLLVLAASCGRCGPAQVGSGATVLQVGPHVLTAEDLACRQKIILDKYPENDDPAVGAVSQLVNGHLYACVLADLGAPITDEQLSTELRRIDEKTHDPEGLTRLKSLCGGAENSAYRRIAILPDFANRRYNYEVFPGHKPVHRERRVRAEGLLAELLAAGDSASLEQAAAHVPGGSFRKLSFSARQGFRPLEEPKSPAAPEMPTQPGADAADPAARPIEDHVFAATPAGTIFHEVVELPEAFAILRWTEWKDQAAGLRLVERLDVPKLTPDEYFWSRAQNIPVLIADKELRSRFQSKVSWALRLRLVDQ